MAYEQITVREIVERAVNHSWSIPEFQRGFVWKATQVRDLAESLWLDYPIGSLLVWNSHAPTEEQRATDAQRPSLWVVDGQQRSTALSILFGRKPYWWPSAEEWNRTLKKYDIRFDINAKEPPYFWVADAVIRKAAGHRYIPLRDLLGLDTARERDQKALQDLAKSIKIEGLCDGMDAMEVYARLDRIRKIRDKDLVAVTVDHELEDVVEIFARLNSRGTRVTEADIYLGIVAARAPGWVRREYLPFVESLGDAGSNQCRLDNRPVTRWPATRRSKLSCRSPVSSRASMCRQSPPSRRTRTQPSSGWNISIPTKARLAG